MKKRFTEEHIIQVLKEHGAGAKVTDICRKHGGMEVPDAKKLKALESENAKLKRLVADLSLDKVVLQDLLSKNW